MDGFGVRSSIGWRTDSTVLREGTIVIHPSVICRRSGAQLGITCMNFLFVVFGSLQAGWLGSKKDVKLISTIKGGAEGVYHPWVCLSFIQHKRLEIVWSFMLLFGVDSTLEVAFKTPQLGPRLNYICVSMSPSLPAHVWEFFLARNQCDNTQSKLQIFKLTSLSLFSS